MKAMHSSHPTSARVTPKSPYCWLYRFMSPGM